MAAKKKTGKPYGNKTKFVMSLPREMPAKQVVDKAKQQGIVISEAHVYKIRSTNKPKGAPGRGAGPKAPTAKPGPKPGAKQASNGQSKRDFVLSFAPSTPASEILKKAKDSGIGLSKAYLYTIRNAAGGGVPAKRGRKPGRPAGVTGLSAPRAAARGGSGLESQFIDAALDMGLSRAAELLDHVRARLKQGL